MRRFYKYIILISVLFISVTVAAQEVKLPEPGITPDSWLYDFKRFFEAVDKFLTVDEMQRAEKHLYYAELRLSEAKAMADIKKAELVDKLAEDYKGELDEANNLATSVKQSDKKEKIIEKIATATFQYIDAVDKVKEAVPEYAKEKISSIKEVSIKSNQEALRTLAKENTESAAKIAVNIAAEKVGKVKQAAEIGNTKEVAEAVVDYERYAKFAEEIAAIARQAGKDPAKVQELVAKSTLLHLAVLENVRQKVPEQSKSAIQRAIEKSTMSKESAEKILEEKGIQIPKETPTERAVPATPAIPAIPSRSGTPAIPAIPSSGSGGGSSAPSKPTVPAPAPSTPTPTPISTPTPTAISITCTDTDNGKDFYERGKATGSYPGSLMAGYIYGENPNKTEAGRYDASIVPYYVYYDWCDDSTTSNHLNEQFCNNSQLTSYGYFCPNGCSNGVCNPAPSQTPTPTPVVTPTPNTTSTPIPTPSCGSGSNCQYCTTCFTCAGQSNCGWGGSSCSQGTSACPAGFTQWFWNSCSINVCATPTPTPTPTNASSQCTSAADVSVYGPAGTGYAGGGSNGVQCVLTYNETRPCTGVYNATGQTFVPTKSGYLAKVDLYISRGKHLLGGTIPLEVRSGSIDGTLLTRKTINVDSLPVDVYGTKVGATTIVFDTTPYLTAGNTYAMLIRSDWNWIIEKGWGEGAVYWDVELDQTQGGWWAFYIHNNIPDSPYTRWMSHNDDMEFKIYLSSSDCTL